MNQKTRILELLKQRPVKNYEFFRMSPPILRASERIRELKKKGHDIVTKRLKARGVWEYTLNTPDKYFEDREVVRDIKDSIIKQLEL